MSRTFSSCKGHPEEDIAAREQADGPLMVAVKLGLQGATYALDALAEHRVKATFPQARGLPLVALGYTSEQEFEERHRPYWEMIGQLLTDLTPEQIGKLGGMRFYEPLADFRVIWEWTPENGGVPGVKARLVKSG